MEPIISCKNLRKVYRIENTRLVALDEITLDIYKGEFLCIVGTSGSGKSTLLSLLAGIEPPTKGSIIIKGQPLHKMNEGELVRFRLKNVGFVFQSFNLLPNLTAMENIALPLTFRGVPRYMRNKRAGRLLKETGLLSHKKHRPSQLSGGQQQRVSIARALATNPDIIFADEPTGNLDSHTGMEIMDLINNLAKTSGKTIIMVTHDIEKAAFADRIVHITDGHISKIEEKEQ